jgi:hypothetical protein
VRNILPARMAALQALHQQACISTCTLLLPAHTACSGASPSGTQEQRPRQRQSRSCSLHPGAAAGSFPRCVGSWCLSQENSKQLRSSRRSHTAAAQQRPQHAPAACTSNMHQQHAPAACSSSCGPALSRAVHMADATTAAACYCSCCCCDVRAVFFACMSYCSQSSDICQQHHTPCCALLTTLPLLQPCRVAGRMTRAWRQQPGGRQWRRPACAAASRSVSQLFCAALRSVLNLAVPAGRQGRHGTAWDGR